MLWMYQRVFYGELGAEVRAHVPDLKLREWAAVVPLIVMMFWMGVYSQSFLPPVGKVDARVLGPNPGECAVPGGSAFREARGGGPCPLVLSPAPDLVRFLPELILTIAGTLLMVLDPVIHKRSSSLFGHLSIWPCWRASAARCMATAHQGPAFGGLLMVDGFATFFNVLVMVVGILTVLPAYKFLEREDAETSEFHALLLFSVAGQCIMASANELIIIFIGLEISSIASYVMAGYLRDDKRANEAALKYFLLGSFATAFFLYGVALIYGATGTINLSAVHAVILGPNAPSPVFIGVAAALMFVGLAFKVSAAPFQIWAPDVYQGAPTPVSAFLSAGPKAAAFAVFLRIFMTAFEPIGGGWVPLVWISRAAFHDDRAISPRCCKPT